MPREFIKLCAQCQEVMAEHYHLTEEQRPDLKRSRCDHCSFRGYLSTYSYDPSRPTREAEGIR